MKHKKLFSISQKLVLLLVALILLPTILLGSISYNIASKTTENEIRAAATENIASMNENLNTFMSMQEENLFVLSQNTNISNITDKKPDEMVYIYDALKGFKEGHKDTMNVYIGLKNKAMHIYPEQQLPADFDPTSRAWYKDAVSKNKVIWTNPYTDAGSNKLIVSVAVPVYNSKKEFVGVLAADISLEQLTSFIGKAKIGSNGYLSLLDNQGLIIAHPDKSLLGKELPVAELKQEVFKIDKGSKDYLYNGSMKCAYFTTINGSGWKLLGVFDYNEIKEKSNVILKTTIISGIVIVLIAILMGVIFSRPIVKSIKILSEDMIKIGDGDLKVRSTIKSRDEIGLLSDKLNKMAEEFGRMIKNIKGLTGEVSTSADTLAASAEETVASTEEVSRTVFEISKVTEDQAQSTESGLIKTTELAENIQGISETISIISQMVTQSNELNQKGLDIMLDLLEKTKTNGSASNQIMEVVSEVDHSSEQIGAIVSTISGIANQTNLLALNASIEAARAGEQGKGFAVVAEEIRKLAEQSSMATNDIHRLIKEIQSKSQNAVITMNEVKPIVEAQGNAVSATQRVFNDISDTINKLTEQVMAVTELNKLMLNSKNEILSVMENISASAEQTSASTQQVAASTQQQLSGMEEVARTAEQLNSLAQKLSAEIEKFSV